MSQSLMSGLADSTHAPLLIMSGLADSTHAPLLIMDLLGCVRVLNTPSCLTVYNMLLS